MNEVAYAIRAFAESYKRFNDFTAEIDKKPFAAANDRIGGIGEFYSFHYLRSIYPTPKFSVKFAASASQEGWDISVTDHGAFDGEYDIFFQVKVCKSDSKKQKFFH